MLSLKGIIYTNCYVRNSKKCRNRLYLPTDLPIGQGTALLDRSGNKGVIIQQKSQGEKEGGTHLFFCL